MKGFFELLSICDFFSPGWGLARDLATDPLQSSHYTFFIDYQGLESRGLNPNDVKDLLQRNGYKPYSPQIATTPTGMKCHITIPREWEQGARELLNLNGILLE